MARIASPQAIPAAKYARAHRRPRISRMAFLSFCFCLSLLLSSHLFSACGGRRRLRRTEGGAAYGRSDAAWEGTRTCGTSKWTRTGLAAGLAFCAVLRVDGARTGLAAGRGLPAPQPGRRISRRARGWWQHLATGRAVHAVGHAPWRAECRTHCILRCSLGTDKAGAVVFCCCTSKAAAVVLLLLLAL